MIQHTRTTKDLLLICSTHNYVATKICLSALYQTTAELTKNQHGLCNLKQATFVNGKWWKWRWQAAGW